jgi:hypothetical protein
LSPFAYGLREHQIFEQPFKIERKLVRRPAPDWTADVSQSEVEVLPLVSDVNRSYSAGWCSYSDDFANLPEVEFFCGGINDKTPTAAGLWRQGNLLHFGFEQSPSEMNDTGRNLLLNSIAYIAQFTEDRPIAVTPSVFAGPVVPALRYPANAIKRGELKLLTNYIAASALAGVRDRAEWFQAMRDYLHPNAADKLEPDPDAVALKAAFGKAAFFERTRAALRDDKTRPQAIRLLARYVPDGPVKSSSTTDWDKWLDENQHYLFFSDAGGYRYYVDPLAKKRGVATADLRGPTRASKAFHADVAEAR